MDITDTRRIHTSSRPTKYLATFGTSSSRNPIYYTNDTSKASKVAPLLLIDNMQPKSSVVNDLDQCPSNGQSTFEAAVTSPLLHIGASCRVEEVLDNETSGETIEGTCFVNINNKAITPDKKPRRLSRSKAINLGGSWSPPMSKVEALFFRDLERKDKSTRNSSSVAKTDTLGRLRVERLATNDDTSDPVPHQHPPLEAAVHISQPKLPPQPATLSSGHENRKYPRSSQVLRNRSPRITGVQAENTEPGKKAHSTAIRGKTFMPLETIIEEGP